MMRRILGSAALLAVAATAATAQTYFHYEGLATTRDYNTGWGHFTGDIPIGFNANSFRVWCVDESTTISTAGNPHLASVTNLASLDMSATRYQNRTNYLKAAWLTDKFGNAAYGPANQQNPQWAIWAVMHSKTGNECREDGIGAHPSGCDAFKVAQLVSEADPGAVDSRQWFVITSTSPKAQEMIAQCQVKEVCDDFDIPNEDPTPEPATMTLLAMGLAGMAGTSLRRRRRS